MSWKMTVRNVLWWAAASAIAVAVLESNAVLGLVAAGLAGIGLGVLLFVGGRP